MTFDQRDTATAQPVMVSLKPRQFFADRNAIGRTVAGGQLSPSAL